MVKRALVIANSVYDDENFATLPGAVADAEALAEVLGDSAIGDFDVTSLVDVGLREAMRSMEAFFAAAASDDLLLLHLSLHGWKDLRNRLFFVMKDTERGLPTSTAIAAETVSDWITHCRSRRIVLTLDCCYSGAFPLGTLRRSESVPKVDVAEPLGGRGRAVITASTSLQYAHESEQNVRSSRTGTQPSVFTSAIVDGLRDGSADLDGDGYISVGDLYEYVHDRVRGMVAGQTPTLSVDSTQGVIRLARSARDPDAGALGEMRSGIAEPKAWKRIGSLHLVERLLGSVRETTRQAARKALLALVGDADPEVARKARDLWYARGLGNLPAPSRSRRPAPPPPPPADPVVAGIDFGTTNSAIAVYLDGDVRVIPNGEGSLSTPSVVAIRPDGEIWVGETARNQAPANPEYTVRSVKPRLGTDWSIARGNVRLTAEQVAGLILAKLKADAESYLGVPIEDAVITVPAHWDDEQRDAMDVAAIHAGLNLCRAMGEPSAAAIMIGAESDQERRVLIFDLGGGTLDVSLVESGEGVVEIVASAGDVHLGGDDWDRVLVHLLTARFGERHGVDLTGDPMAAGRLLAAAERAKIALSSDETARVDLPYITTGTDGLPLHLDETVTREEFEAATMDLLGRCEMAVRHVLTDAGVPLSAVDQIILAGGASAMPAISRMLATTTRSKHLYRGVITDGVVGGAAFYGQILAEDAKRAAVGEDPPVTVGVRTRDGAVVPLTEAPTGDGFPRSATVLRAPGDGGSPVVCFVEYVAESEADCIPLAVVEPSGLPDDPGAARELEVSLDGDEHGVGHLLVRDTATGAETAAVLDHIAVEDAAALVASSEWPDYIKRMPTGVSPA